MSMQPSEDEILREVEALRDIKRRSTAQGGPGILAIDPDLPELSSSPSSAHSSSTWPGSNGSTSDSSNPNVINDPSHLFWVPAHLHPEIAPQEFREFLKEHSRDAISGTSSNDPDLLSPRSSKVSRRKSMLSRQYKPSETDGVEDEQVIIRSNTLSSSRATPQLTINDLQKLDEIAQAVSQGEDISNISTMLRRSLSLNSTEMADHKPLSPNMDDTDSPIIVPLPNQILRRAARTKIRKPSLQGDGGGHRFPSSRRAVRSNTISTTDGSEHDHADSFMRVTQEHETESDHRPSSYTDETSILDSYSDKRDSLTSSESHGRSEDDHRSAASPLPFQIPLVSTTPQLQLDLHPFEFSLTTPSATFHEPIPQQSTIPSTFDVLPSRSPSPTPSDTGSTEIISSPSSPAPSSHKDTQSPSNDLSPASQTSRQLPLTISHPPHPRKDKDKEKEKKGLFGKWGSDKKKGKTEVTRSDGKDLRDREKEKDSGFFGSLFGGKKKPEEFNNIGLSHGNTNPASTTALLGASKVNKPNIRTPSPQPSGSYARYPIHVERAIYRLSHIKLANARRPLLEQVLISNLMFWYLGIINKQATTNLPSAQNQTFEQITQQTAQGTPQEKEIPSQERENMEREAREVAEFARRETARKGSLSRGSKPIINEAGTRRTEVPIRGPQYESQYRAMEQEFTPTSSHNYNGGGYPNQGPPPSPSVARTGSAPPAPMSSSPVYQQYSNQKLGLTPHQVAQNKAVPTSNSTSQSSNAYENVHLYHPQPVHQPANASYVLPPGAMSPQIGFDKTWQNPTSRGTSTTSASQGPYTHSSPSPPPTTTSTITNQQQSSQLPPPRQPRSPPPQNYPSNTKSRSVTPPGGRVSRSVSAETFPQGANAGKLKKKSLQPSNTDLKPHRRLSDVDSPGDDVPLAVWQQQHRAAGTNHQFGASA